MNMLGTGKIDSLKTKFNKILKRKSFKYGAPFLLCMLGGSFGLREFAQLRYTYTRTSTVQRNELKEHGIELKDSKETTIDAQYEKIKTMDIDNWEQIRGPRPWEENTS